MGSTSPLNSSSFVGFLLSCSVKGVAIAVAIVLTLDTAIVESRNEAPKGLARFPNRFSSRDGHPYYYHRMEYDFLFSPVSLSSCFFTCLSLCFIFPPTPSLRRYFPLLRVASSVQQLSVLLEYLCFLLTALLISWSNLHHVSFRNLVLFHCLLVLFSDFACDVVFSNSVRWQFTSFAHGFAIICCFWCFSVSPSVTT